MSTGTTSSFQSGFKETDALFLEFDDAFNNAQGSSSILISISPGVEKPIFPHAVRFSNTIGACQPTAQNGGMSGILALPVRSLFELIISVNRVVVFRETHTRNGQFISQAATDAHNQMLELQAQPTSNGSQPVSGDEICETILDRRSGYSKGLGLGSKPKSKKSATSSLTSCS
ncbi:CACTA en-spm transposon protein [Cucumis melo var. makuwa]|uniref:CACTA en-spm transposon protein n=1 Tax=Cucumis melo var. makuwa TaxID=1194695 RepID=A0A5A7UVR2_CUCMM|nr:CACTA en-spm transposon protein [Cucumis melo var. makuwa]